MVDLPLEPLNYLQDLFDDTSEEESPESTYSSESESSISDVSTGDARVENLVGYVHVDGTFARTVIGANDRSANGLGVWGELGLEASAVAKENPESEFNVDLVWDTTNGEPGTGPVQFEVKIKESPDVRAEFINKDSDFWDWEVWPMTNRDAAQVINVDSDNEETFILTFDDVADFALYRFTAEDMITPDADGEGGDLRVLFSIYHRATARIQVFETTIRIRYRKLEECCYSSGKLPFGSPDPCPKEQEYIDGRWNPENEKLPLGWNCSDPSIGWVFALYGPEGFDQPTWSAFETPLDVGIEWAAGGNGWFPGNVVGGRISEGFCVLSGCPNGGCSRGGFFGGWVVSYVPKLAGLLGCGWSAAEHDPNSIDHGCYGNIYPDPPNNIMTVLSTSEYARQRVRDSEDEQPPKATVKVAEYDQRYSGVWAINDNEETQSCAGIRVGSQNAEWVVDEVGEQYPGLTTFTDPVEPEFDTDYTCTTGETTGGLIVNTGCFDGWTGTEINDGGLIAADSYYSECSAVTFSDIDRVSLDIAACIPPQFLTDNVGQPLDLSDPTAACAAVSENFDTEERFGLSKSMEGDGGCIDCSQRGFNNDLVPCNSSTSWDCKFGNDCLNRGDIKITCEALEFFGTITYTSCWGNDNYYQQGVPIEGGATCDLVNCNNLSLDVTPYEDPCEAGIPGGDDTSGNSYTGECLGGTVGWTILDTVNEEDSGASDDGVLIQDAPDTSYRMRILGGINFNSEGTINGNQVLSGQIVSLCEDLENALPCALWGCQATGDPATLEINTQIDMNCDFTNQNGSSPFFLLRTNRYYWRFTDPATGDPLPDPELASTVATISFPVSSCPSVGYLKDETWFDNGMPEFIYLTSTNLLDKPVRGGDAFPRYYPLSKNGLRDVRFTGDDGTKAFEAFGNTEAVTGIYYNRPDVNGVIDHQYTAIVPRAGFYVPPPEKAALFNCSQESIATITLTEPYPSPRTRSGFRYQINAAVEAKTVVDIGLDSIDTEPTGTNAYDDWPYNLTKPEIRGWLEGTAQIVGTPEELPELTEIETDVNNRVAYMITKERNPSCPKVIEAVGAETIQIQSIGTEKIDPETGEPYPAWDQIGDGAYVTSVEIPAGTYGGLALFFPTPPPNNANGYDDPLWSSWSVQVIRPSGEIETLSKNLLPIITNDDDGNEEKIIREAGYQFFLGEELRSLAEPVRIFFIASNPSHDGSTVPELNGTPTGFTLDLQRVSPSQTSDMPSLLLDPSLVDECFVPGFYLMQFDSEETKAQCCQCSAGNDTATPLTPTAIEAQIPCAGVLGYYGPVEIPPGIPRTSYEYRDEEDSNDRFTSSSSSSSSSSSVTEEPATESESSASA